MFVQLSMASGLAENCPVVFSLHGFHNLNLSIKNRIRISSSMLSIWTDEGYFFVNLVSLLHGRAGLRFQFSSFGFCFEAVVLHGRCTSISNTKGSLSKCVCVCLSVCVALSSASLIDDPPFPVAMFRLKGVPATNQAFPKHAACYCDRSCLVGNCPCNGPTTAMRPPHSQPDRPVQTAVAAATSM
jgi:hypothetical protein